VPTSAMSVQGRLWINGAATSTYMAERQRVFVASACHIKIAVTVSMSATIAQYEYTNWTANANSNIEAFYDENYTKTEIGRNGICSRWAAHEWLYYSEATGLRHEGQQDIPGILATGSISSSGYYSNVWGAKAATTNAYYTAVGLYRVYHNIGHVNYTVNINCATAGATGSYVTKATNYVDIQIYRNGSNYQSAFDYTLIGRNHA